jgi:hypothetical protein
MKLSIFAKLSISYIAVSAALNACGTAAVPNLEVTDAQGSEESSGNRGRRPNNTASSQTTPAETPKPALQSTNTVVAIEQAPNPNAGLACGSKVVYLNLASSINRQLALGTLQLADNWPHAKYNWDGTGCFLGIKQSTPASTCGVAIYNALPIEMQGVSAAESLKNLVPGIDYRVTGAWSKTQTFTPVPFYSAENTIVDGTQTWLYTHVSLEKLNSDGSSNITVAQVRAVSGSTNYLMTSFAMTLPASSTCFNAEFQATLSKVQPLTVKK